MGCVQSKGSPVRSDRRLWVTRRVMSNARASSELRQAVKGSLVSRKYIVLLQMAHLQEYVGANNSCLVERVP